jgi:hypothetical protein
MTTQAPEKQIRKPQKQRQEPPLPRQHLPTPHVSPRDDISERETRPALRRDTQIFKYLEYTLTIVSFTVLLIVLSLIGLAVFSVDANTLIATILHVDIRAEIAYLLQLIKHLHLH